MPPGPRRSLGRRYRADGAAAPSPGALRGRVTCARPGVRPSSPGGMENARAESLGRPRFCQACRNRLNPVVSPETAAQGTRGCYPSKRIRRFFNVLGLPLAALSYFSSSSLGRLPPLPSPCRRPGCLEGGSALPGDCGARCSPTWFPSTPPPADDAPRGSHSRSCQPALGPQQGACCSSAGNAALPRCRAGRGLRAVAVRSRPYPAAPGPARADPAGPGGVPGLAG